MKDFIEKLIGRLDEELKFAREMQTTQCIGHDGYGTPLQSKLGGEICALLKVQNIVNQFAEEYKEINIPTIDAGELFGNGWIPCSERLPEEQKCKDGHIDPSEEVLVYIYYGKNCVNNGCGVSRYWNSSKHHENPWIDLKYGKDNVIAWQPLPEPFKPKGE